MHKISCYLSTSHAQAHQGFLCDPQKREGLELTNKQTLKGYLKGSSQQSFQKHLNMHLKIWGGEITYFFEKIKRNMQLNII